MGSHLPINIFHILVVSPFFLYVAIVRGQLAPWIFSVLSGLGIVLLVYHGYKTFIKWKAQSPSLWINAIHVFAVAPLLIYIGSKGYDTPRWAFEILALFGFGALGYHIYSIILQAQEMGPNVSVKKSDMSTVTYTPTNSSTL
jgi:threonine/homoserine/homoserine lactone efflux protein